MPDQPSGHPWRRRLRLSVRALMILIMILGSTLGWWLNQARKRQESVAALDRLGAQIGRDCVLVNGDWIAKSPPWIVRWMRKALGDAPFEEVKVVSLDTTAVTDSDLAFVEPLRELDTLSLSTTQIGDEGLKHLAGLHCLRKLYLEKTMVTDQGLAHLEGLDDLETLALSGSRVGYAGLAHLRRMKRLKLLAVYSTDVTQEGIADLMRELPNLRVESGQW